MAGAALTVASVLQCPHGGKVTAVSSNTRTAAGGAFVLRASDTFTIAGCLANSPCVTVQWVAPDTRVAVSSGQTLSRGSVGLCLNAASAPQGSVVVLVTQPSVSTV